MSATKYNKSNLKVVAETQKVPSQPDTTIPLEGKRLKPSNHLPERYTIKNLEEERVLICLEAPNINVHVEAGLAVSGSVARKSPGGTIFLDGVAQCEPFMDHERQVYNLDHHEGCVRAFTLATCEQTLVMYMKGLDLQGREWNVFANEPDLDALLSIWILLNHSRIGKMDTTQRRILFALVRYEGVIDALGLELKELSALPPDLVRKIQRVIDHLRSDELALKKEGRWGQTDYLAYTVTILHKIDQIFYKSSDFSDYRGVEELARVELPDQRIAAVVEADMGIYEIEPYLNKLYGNRLGFVFLKTGEHSYTVRQMHLFMPITLEEIYDRLNFIDPAVKYRTQGNKWGGAEDIGGSPRDTGTQLSPSELCDTCRDAVSRTGIWQQVYRFGMTTALAGLVLLIAYVLKFNWEPARWFGIEDISAFWSHRETGFITTILIAVGISLLVIAPSRPWQYGFSQTVGRKWWLFLPLVLVAGVFGGAWLPDLSAQGQNLFFMFILGIVGMPLVSEMLFRGLAHGLLIHGSRIQRDDTRLFISWPNLGSTLLYVVFVYFLILFSGINETEAFYWKDALTLLSAAVFGASLGMVRERSQSLYPAILFHMVAAGAAMLVVRYL